MNASPTLLTLCSQAIADAIAAQAEHLRPQDVLELPLHLLQNVLDLLTPLALQTLSDKSNGRCVREGGTGDKISGIKRARSDDFNMRWQKLFSEHWGLYAIQFASRWAENPKLAGCCCSDLDWQQLYWEKHTQLILESAAEFALLPGFSGRFYEHTIPESVLQNIGCSLPIELKKLGYHIKRFGRYARSLKLQSVLCVEEICEMLSDCKLQKLTFTWIISKTQVNGVCRLLESQRETLTSLDLLHCWLCPTSLNQIHNVLCKEESKAHGIQHFGIDSGQISDRMSAKSSGLLSFLLLGRSLRSLRFCDTKMRATHANAILDTLIESSCALVTFEISENNISGWLSKLETKKIESGGFLKSLITLILRDDNLDANDACDLFHVLIRLPNLTSLDISSNPITDKGIRYLCPYFEQAMERENVLSNLKLENCELTSLGVKELLKSLSSGKGSLSTLSVAENNLGSSIAMAIATFLAASSLNELNLEDISLGEEGFRLLDRHMPMETAPSSVNISKNRGRCAAASFLSTLISKALNLAYVNAGDNFLPPESVEMIYGALKNAGGKLEQVNLTGNNRLYASDGAASLQEFRRCGKPIVTLHRQPMQGAPYDDEP